MSTEEYLSEGSLDIILEQMNDKLHPIVQLLGTKVMANNRIRSVIWDGQKLCQHCIFISEDLEKLHNENQLDKFTVVRLEQYSVSSLPKKENMPVILVMRLTVLKPGLFFEFVRFRQYLLIISFLGSELGRKLNSSEKFSVSVKMENRQMDTSIASTSSFVSSVPSTPTMSIPAHQPSIFKEENICPINVLTPFFNAWVIRVRVTNKSALRTYNNAKGAGKLFNFDVCDESGEIRITAFNAECDRFFNMIEKDNLYYITKGIIKPANKKFSSLNCDYEITLGQQSVIEICDNASIPLPKQRYKFVVLSHVNDLPASTVVDAIGVVRSITNAETFVSKKTSKELTKKEVNIVDSSLAEARVTLWNDLANEFNPDVGQTVAFKALLVGDFKGKTLSTSNNTSYQIDPEIEENRILKNWYQSQGSKETFNALCKDTEQGAVSINTRFIGQINELKLSPGETQTSVFVGLIQSTNRSSNHLYKACGFNGCQKKVTDDNNGLYFCSKCDRSSPTCTWRLMLNLLLSDVSGNAWVTVFQEAGEKLLGKTALELAELYESDQNEYLNVLNTIRFKSFHFRVYTRTDTFNNEVRLRTNLSNFNPISSVERANHLMRSIDALEQQIAV